MNCSYCNTQDIPSPHAHLHIPLCRIADAIEERNHLLEKSLARTLESDVERLRLLKIAIAGEGQEMLGLAGVLRRVKEVLNTEGNQATRDLLTELIEEQARKEKGEHR